MSEIKTILCRIGQTTWELVRLEPHDFKHISRLGVTGHPVYYRLVPPLERLGPHATAAEFFPHDLKEYEVWPLPGDTVEVIPVYRSPEATDPPQD